VRQRSRVEDLAHGSEEKADPALEGEVGIGESGRVLPALEPLGGRLAGGQQEGDEANQLAHGDVANAQSYDLQQFAQAFSDLRMHQRGAVGQDGVGVVETGVEPLVRKALDHLSHNTRRQQVA
jgi:hypothetical protein